MDVRSLLKEWRIWVLFIALISSTVLLAPQYERTDAGELTITTNLEDRKSIEFSGGTRILLGLQSNETGQALQEQVQQVETVLQLRLSSAGLADTEVRGIDLGGGQHKIQVQTGSSNTTQLRELISQQGSFEARLPIFVQDSKNFTIDETYRFEYENGSVTATGPSGTVGPFEENESFTLNNNTFYYINTTEESARLEVVAYNGEDIIEVLSSQGRLTGSQGSYRWSFQISIEQEAAQRVQKISKNYQTVVGGGGGSQLGLENGQPAMLTYYVDGESETSLTVAATFKRQVITQPSIQGGAETREQAVNERDRLQAILQSGQLPVPVQAESVNQISSSLGDEFFSASVISIIAALVAVGGIIFVRYRDPRVVLPIILTGASEIYILLGFWFSTVGTLSLSAIAGIIAAVGTGVDDQIIITDESGREKVESWSSRMKKAFFVIFTSAASTIGAMAPVVQPGLVSLLIGASGAGLVGYTLYSKSTNLHYLGIGAIALMVGVFTSQLEPSGTALQSIHEFAFTTIWGIVIGITITRPAYAKTIEYIKQD
jgi:preprotein translocase subunit SecD